MQCTLIIFISLHLLSDTLLFRTCPILHLFFFKSNVSWPYVWGHVVFHWRRVNLSVFHLNKTDSASPSSYQLLVGSSMARCGTSFPTVFSMLGLALVGVWTVLVHALTILWVHTCSCPVLSGRLCFPVVTHHLCILHSFWFLFNNDS